MIKMVGASGSFSREVLDAVSGMPQLERIRTSPPNVETTGIPVVFALARANTASHLQERHRDPAARSKRLLMIRYKEVAFTAYPTTNIPRSRKFFEGILGLKPNAPVK